MTFTKEGSDMRDQCCGKPLTHNEEKHRYECMTCGSVLSGYVARESENFDTATGKDLDRLAEYFTSRRSDETDVEYRRRILERLESDEISRLQELGFVTANKVYKRLTGEELFRANDPKGAALLNVLATLIVESKKGRL